MDRKEIERLVGSCIASYIPQSEFQPEERLKEDLGLDSLLLVNVVVDMENALETSFDDGALDPAELTTVESLYRLAEQSL